MYSDALLKIEGSYGSIIYSVPIYNCLIKFLFYQKTRAQRIMIMLILTFIVISILVTWTEQESKESWTAFFGILYGYFLAGNGILLLIIGIIQFIVQSIRNKTKKL